MRFDGDNEIKRETYVSNDICVLIAEDKASDGAEEALGHEEVLRRDDGDDALEGADLTQTVGNVGN